MQQWEAIKTKHTPRPISKTRQIHNLGYFQPTIVNVRPCAKIMESLLGMSRMCVLVLVVLARVLGEVASKQKIVTFVKATWSVQEEFRLEEFSRNAFKITF